MSARTGPAWAYNVNFTSQRGVNGSKILTYFWNEMRNIFETVLRDKSAWIDEKKMKLNFCVKFEYKRKGRKTLHTNSASEKQNSIATTWNALSSAVKWTLNYREPFQSFSLLYILLMILRFEYSLSILLIRTIIFLNDSFYSYDLCRFKNTTFDKLKYNLGLQYVCSTHPFEQ